METRYPDTIKLLVNTYAKLTPELQKAARFMVEYPEEIGLNAMRSVARDAGVKPATVSRLAKRLGFAEYRMLRAQEIANIERSLSDDNYAVMEAAVQSLHDSDRVYVLGLRGAYAPAFLFHYAYQLFQDNSQLLDTRAGTFADQLRGIGANDSLLVVSFLPYTLLTIDAVEYAAEAGAKITAITDSIVSPAASAAAHTIITSNQSPSFYHSLTGAMAVVQALITLLVTKSGGDALKIIAEAEKQLSRISAYW